MRVLIDTTYARRAPYSGTAVYLERIVAALRALPGLEVVTAANDSRRAPGGGGLATLANATADLLWTERELPRRARATGADVIHHPLPAYAYAYASGRASARPLDRATPQVVTVHDLAFERVPDRFAPAFRRYAHLAHRDAARRARGVIAVSQTTAADIAQLWGIASERIVVARHGPGQELPPAARAREPSHFLYVGDDEPRKDLPTLLDAHRRYAATAADPLPLVLAGSARAPGARAVEHPAPERLAELLAGAAALIHPAVYEGFGLTALEAMAAGTPVLAAAAPGTVEVCGTAARLVPVGDAAALAAALDEVAGSRALRDELRRAGQERASTFSWKLAARAHVEAYDLAFTR